ncbi:hypothetical protein BKK49_03110 [Rodentibacter rarus]|uniref:DUF1266 domain-containing protein n=1 Tax=Rodentibacter rarus TaxID=1908260 RepID=UPI0009C54E2C|nr:DUF1266 domain-containing protein [Rodentibacter rarus]OOF42218.1 hypothetical protein BKK49_03110 [Rodentibacter rarus]
MSIAEKLKTKQLRGGKISQIQAVPAFIVGIALIIGELTNTYLLFDGKWTTTIVGGIVAVYGVITFFLGWLWVAAVEHEIGKPFFGLLTLPEPKQPLRNDEEKYAFLVDGFYESSNILYDDKESLTELAKNPYYRREASVNYGEALALNDLCGIYNKAASNVKTSLENSWDIKDSKSAQKTLSALWEGTIEGAEILLTAYNNFDDLHQSIVELGFLTKTLDAAQINVSGFDLVRTIWVARNSYVAGYIDAEELRAISHNVAAFTAANYANWHELGYSYLISYLAWLDDAKPNLAYHMLKERVYAVSQYLSSLYSPLADTSLDELRAYVDSLPEVES